MVVVCMEEDPVKELKLRRFSVEQWELSHAVLFHYSDDGGPPGLAYNEVLPHKPGHGYRHGPGVFGEYCKSFNCEPPFQR